MTKKNNFFGNQGSAMLSPSAQNKAEDNKKETEFTPISLAGKRIVERGSVDDKVRSGAHKTYSTKKLAEEKFASAMGRFSQENDKISVPDMPQTKGRKFLPGNEALAEKMQEAESIGYDNYLKNKTENKKPDVKKIFLSDNTRDRIEGRIGSPETAFEITKKNGDDLSWVQRRITETGSSTWEEYLNTVTEDDAAEFNSEVLNGMGILSRSYALDIISASKKNKARSDLVSAQKELGGVDIEESYYVNLIAGQRATELKGVRPEDYVYRGYQRSDDDDEDFALYMGEIYDRAEAEALHRVYNDDEIDIAASNMYKNNGGWLQSVMSPMENGVARKALGLANRLGRLTDEETEKAVEIMTKESETDAINLDKTATAINRAREANWTDSVNNLRENPDFEEKSKLTNEDALEVSMKYDHGPKSDINAESELDEGRKFAAIALNIPSDDAKVLTDEEVASIIYIAHTMGEKDGQAYYKTLKDDVNARKMDEHVRKTEQFATAHPYLASAKEHTVDAVAAGAKNAMYAASDIIGGITGKEYTPIDINDERFFHDRDLQITQAITDEKIKNPAIRAAYNVGMSVAENAFRTISAAAVGGAIAGAPGAAAGAKLATVLMASNAYQSGVYDATKRGASKGAAMAYGLLSGGIELATEQIGIDNFIDILEKAVKHGSKSILWDIGKQMTAEGVEEFIAAVAEPIYDDMVLGEKSHFNLRVKELEASGMDHNSAREQAMSEQVAEVLTSTAAGVISGGIMAGGGVAIGSGVKAASDLSAANHELKRMSPHSKDKGKSITPLVGETDSTAVENVFGNNAGNIETSDTNSASSRLPMSDSTLREGNNAERMASTMKKGTDIVINRLSEGEWSEEHESIYNNAV
ncbi:MAG: hypothetical protein IJ297_01900, partial [Clostridia bacterium]|nr:hypothetical protein [Clostridia bacterium]